VGAGFAAHRQEILIKGSVTWSAADASPQGEEAMKAQNIRKGDRLNAQPAPYEVIDDPVIVGSVVRVNVRFDLHGDTGTRYFDIDQEVPLTASSRERDSG
jgi:hypothetical protein